MTTKSYFKELENEFGRLSFGDAILSFRKSMELSQVDFAKKLDLSVQNVCDIEKGRRIPAPSRAAKIADGLGLPQKLLIEISLRDSLSKDGFNYSVSLG